MGSDKITCGEILTDCRKEKGLQLKEVALQLEINRSSLTRYENDENLPETAIMMKLCDLYNLSMDYLCGRVNSNVDLGALNRPFGENNTLLVGDLLKRLCELKEEDKLRILDYIDLIERAGVGDNNRK